VLELDASQGEGGGQVLRTALAMAAITGQGVRLANLRANRPEPGLKAQHAAVAKAFATLTQGKVEGADIGSRTLAFHPGTMAGGEVHVDIGTAGSIPLFLQALMPALAAGKAFWRITVTGGTDGAWAPTWDYLARVHVNTLERLGWRPRAKLQRRGWWPRGGGGAILEAQPWTPRPFALERTGQPFEVGGRIALSNLPEHVGQRVRSSAIETLAQAGWPQPEVHVTGMPALDPGVAIALWADDGRCILGADGLGAKGVPSEEVGAQAAQALVQEVQGGGSVDAHAADMLMAYAALAAPSTYTVGALSEHARTNAKVVEAFLPVRFTFTPEGSTTRVRTAPA
jgi:RNA 3'-terminal phosphate cyclase (ATP)